MPSLNSAAVPVSLSADLHLTAENTMQRVVQASKTRLINMYKEATVLAGYGLFEETDGEQSRGGVPVDDIFVNVQLVKQEDLVTLFDDGPKSACTITAASPSHVLQSGAKSKRISLHDIFQPSCVSPGQSSSNVTSILAVGCAGIGKSTTFTCKFPYDWALERCLPDVDLLLCITLGEGDSIRISSTEELLSSLLDLGGEEKSVMLSFVREHPSRVCVVLDGVDEGDLTKCSRFIMKLLKGQPIYKGLRTVVTSRPCPAVHQLVQEGCFDRCLEVVGFSSADVEVFINKALPVDVSCSMMEALVLNTDAASLMTTPFMAAVCCEEYRCKKTLSSCTTSIFSQMLLRLLEKQSGRSMDNLESLSPEQDDVMRELGCFAFVKLYAREYVFSEADKELVKLSEKAVKLGVLVSSQKKLSQGQHRRYRFSHLLLQEFFAAYYAVLCLVRCPGDIDELLADFSFLDPHAKNFIIFLCAMLKDPLLIHLLCVSEKELEFLDAGDLSRTSRHGSRNRTRLDGNGLKKIHGLLVSCMDRSMMKSLADILLDGVAPCRGSVFVSNHMSSAREPNDSDFLLTLLEIWMEKRPLASFSMLNRSLAQVGDGRLVQLEEVKAFLCAADTRDPSLPDIEDGLVKEEEQLDPALAQDLRYAYPDKNERHRAVLIFEFYAIIRLALYEYVEHRAAVSNVVQYSSFAFNQIYIAGNIQDHTSRIAAILPLLHSCKVSSVSIRDEEESQSICSTDGALKLLQALCSCQSFGVIVLRSIRLTTERLRALSDLLVTHKNSVKGFAVYYCTMPPHISRTLLSTLLSGVVSCSKLTRLILDGIPLDAQCVDVLAVALSHGSLPQLELLSVTRTLLYSHGCSVLMQSLKDGSCPKLRVLDLGATGMSNVCATALCQLLQGNPQLVDVIIPHNCLFATLEDPLSVVLWMKVAVTVRSSRNLKGLVLFWNDTIPMFSLLGMMFIGLVQAEQCSLSAIVA